MQRILDYTTNNINWIKMKADGTPDGIDKKKRKQYIDLMSYLYAHQEIAINNGQKDLRQIMAMNARQELIGGVDKPPPRLMLREISWHQREELWPRKLMCAPPAAPWRKSPGICATPKGKA